MLASRDKKRRKAKMEEGLVQSQANTQAAIAATETKAKGDRALEILKSKLASKARNEELESLKQQEIIKFTSIAKVETLKSIVNKEGGDISQVPSWVTDGIPLVNDVSIALMEENLMTANEQIDEQQLEQEALMEEEQMMQQEVEGQMNQEQMV
jgi:hypothetical protein